MAISQRIRAGARIVAILLLLVWICVDFEEVEIMEQPLTGVLHPIDKQGRYCWQVGRFRIFYHDEGEHAPPLLDANGNSVPDFVENIGIQLTAAQHVFCSILQLPDPLFSERYPKVNYIDVRIFSRQKNRNARGLAFDEPSPSFLNNSESLVIYIANDIDIVKNATPAHEYFHQIQNGASYFKNPWYYEGLAVWSEDIFLKRQTMHPNKSQLLQKLDSADWVKKLLKTSYKAGKMWWIPMMETLGEKTDLSEDLFVRDCVYIDGTPVFADFSLMGGNVVQTFFTCLSGKDVQAFTEYSYSQWSETNQRCPQNNKFIIEALRQTIAHYEAAL